MPPSSACKGNLGNSIRSQGPALTAHWREAKCNLHVVETPPQSKGKWHVILGERKEGLKIWGTGRMALAGWHRRRSGDRALGLFAPGLGTITHRLCMGLESPAWLDLFPLFLSGLRPASASSVLTSISNSPKSSMQVWTLAFSFSLHSRPVLFPHVVGDF